MNRTSFVKPLSSPCGKPGFWQCHVAFWVWRTVPFVLLAVGTLGNILSLAVLSRTRMRRNVTTKYLVVLAVCDLIFLWTGLLRNTLLRVISVDMKTLSTFNCKFHEWVVLWSCFTSSWMLVLMTKERALYTLFPHFSRQHITKRFVICSICCVVGTMCLLPFHFVFGNALQEKRVSVPGPQWLVQNISQTVCGPSTDDYTECLSGGWIYLNTLAFSITPSALIFIGNVVIAVTFMYRRRKIQPTGTGLRNSSNKTKPLTKLLFILSVFFLLTTTPYAMFMVVFSRRHRSLDDSQFASFQLMNSLVMMLLFSNYTFNFALYCMNGSIFRQELKCLLGNTMNNLRTVFRRRPMKSSTEMTDSATQAVSDRLFELQRNLIARELEQIQPL